MLQLTVCEYESTRNRSAFMLAYKIVNPMTFSTRLYNLLSLIDFIRKNFDFFLVHLKFTGQK